VTQKRVIQKRCFKNDAGPTGPASGAA